MRRFTPVEVFVGAGVLAAAWGLVGSWATLLAIPPVLWLAARTGLSGQGLFPAYGLALLPLATLATLYVLRGLGVLQPNAVVSALGSVQVTRWDVVFPVYVAFGTAIPHAVTCCVLHFQTAFEGGDGRWFRCLAVTLASLLLSTFLLSLDPGGIFESLWWTWG